MSWSNALFVLIDVLSGAFRRVVLLGESLVFRHPILVSSQKLLLG
jgi:hypothetical protein